MVQETSGEHEEDIRLESTKKRRMDFKVRVRALLPVKFVKLCDFQPPTFNFVEQLKYQRIDKFVSEIRVVYTDLVKSFMHNLSINLDKHDKHMLKTVVRNCEIYEDLDNIAMSLGIPSSGYFLRKGFTFTDGPWAEYSTMEYFYSICRVPREQVMAGQRTARTLRYAKHFTVNDRMLHYIICYVLVPKDYNHSQISELEMQIIFAIKNKIRINWILTMMYHLRSHLSLSTRLPYGCLISRILEQTDMEIDRESVVRMKISLNEINGATITKNTGIIRNEDNSYSYQDAAPVNFQIPDGGTTNEFLYLTMMNHHREMLNHHRETTRAINSLRQLVLNSQETHGEENMVDEEDDEEEEESKAEE